VMGFMDKGPAILCPLGIPEFDRAGVGLVAKELLLYIGPKGSGKTWFAVHCGKQGLIHHQKVLHISLEVREEEVAARYCQALFGGARRPNRYDVTELEFDELARLAGFNTNKQVRPRIDFSAPEARKVLRSKMKSWGIRLGRIVIKEFPTSGLTVSTLTNYLDYLELAHNFVPTIFILDYPDLMDIKLADYRLGVRRVYEQIRGLCVKRNMAGVTPTQGNRSSIDAKRVSASMVAEDKSKLDTSDTVITYSQTKAELRLGLA